MSTHSNSDDSLTIAAIAVLAFVLADVAHEVIGHGIGFLIAGGRSCILTTTRLIETQRLGDRGGAIFDLGGPFGNLVFAGVPWLAQAFCAAPLHAAANATAARTAGTAAKVSGSG